MGVLDFLKRFSSPKEVKKVPFEDLSQWVDSWASKVVGAAKLEVGTVREKIEEEKKKLQNNISILQQTELKNPNIPERARVIVQGNKVTYVQKVTMLLDKVDLPESLNDIVEFCDSFDKFLDAFSKSTMRNYQILQEFFGNQTSAVAINIKNLDAYMKQLKKIIENARIDKVEALKAEIKDVQQQKLRKEDSQKILKIIPIKSIQFPQNFVFLPIL